MPLEYMGEVLRYPANRGKRRAPLPERAEMCVTCSNVGECSPSCRVCAGRFGLWRTDVAEAKLAIAEAKCAELESRAEVAETWLVALIGPPVEFVQPGGAGGPWPEDMR